MAVELVAVVLLLVVEVLVAVPVVVAVVVVLATVAALVGRALVFAGTCPVALDKEVKAFGALSAQACTMLAHPAT